MDTEEPHSDGWLSPLTAEERTDLEIRALAILYEHLRADLDETKARVAAIEAALAIRDEDTR